MLVITVVVSIVGAALVWELSRRARWAGYVYLLNDSGFSVQHRKVKAVHLRPKGATDFRQIETDLSLYEGAYRMTAKQPFEGEGRFIFSPAPLDLDEIIEISGADLNRLGQTGS
jgi:hypothetical protein